MSVRKVYNVTVNGINVFTGTYAMCLAAYEALFRVKNANLLGIPSPQENFIICLSFSPDVDLDD